MPKFHCHTCGQWHDELPMDAGFDEPQHIDELGIDDRRWRVSEAGDFRTLRAEDGTFHYFVRGVIEIPVDSLDDTFAYGVWASLSEESYVAARAAYDANAPAGPFFGWLCNHLVGYPETLNLKTNVFLRPDLKPLIELHETDHPLAVEQEEGITEDRVRQIVEPLLHPERTVVDSKRE